MDNLDDSENNAKVSDSAYSTSCSNSQSRRSRSSKSTHSGSHSSGSSGYGRKQSTSGISNTFSHPAEKRTKDKDGKKKKQVHTELVQVQADVEFRLPEPAPLCEDKKQVRNVLPPPTLSPAEIGVQNIDTTTEMMTCEDMIINQTLQSPMQVVMSRPGSSSDGFSCVISMHDGVVTYTTSSLTTTLGFPKDMWIGRSFIDFVHPWDHSTFASQITNGLAVPKKGNGTQDAVQSPENAVSTMFCRIRRYRGLTSSFGVKDRSISFMPFMLKLSFKNVNNENGSVFYLVIQATPLFSAFKTAHEVVTKAVPFVMRHVSNGNLDHIDQESVPLTGYLPQDVIGKNVLKLYHPDDLGYVRQIYETIVREGGAPRSKPYRLMAYNGHYLKLETEWSSFINPWSRKLEFVIAKHYVIEGPANPEVFQTPIAEAKISEEDKNKAQGLIDSIVRIMNEGLTKPAEFAKQQMNKRCQDLASFMEILMDEQPKVEEELCLEIQEQDNSYYERDSVMLGGISPHHDCNDSKSSTTTLLSYNQLNYNENLQRYFDSHQEISYAEYQTRSENIVAMKARREVHGERMSPMAVQSSDSAELMSSGESSGAALGEGCPNTREYHLPRLTQSLLIKHNTEMEKTLVMQHRECRHFNKKMRDKATNDTSQKKKDHLARCNASFLPTLVESTEVDTAQSHGVKRALDQPEKDTTSHKLHCTAPRAARHRPSPVTSASQWQTSSPTGMNPFMSSMGMSQQMSLMSPMTAVPGLIPMYYVPAGGPALQSSSTMTSTDAKFSTPFQAPPMQYMMYGPAVIGPPFVVSPINPQVQYSMQHTMMTQFAPAPSPLVLASRNFEESAEAISENSNSRDCKMKGNGMSNSEEPVSRTDGESSYSSFYSSFFKTESGSADDSSDAKKSQSKSRGSLTADSDKQRGKVMRRKRDPPWMEQVCVTSELVYKYQILTKNVDEVLSADKQKMSLLQQPSLVNEQLGQLYMDMELEGVAARLTLEEGITSSGSSSDENNAKIGTGGLVKRLKTRREHSKLVMIYEEDAPLPPPVEIENSPEPSTSLSWPV